MSGSNNNEILDVLKAQNKLILQVLESQNNILKTQNNILKSIDASLKEKSGRRESPSSKQTRLVRGSKEEKLLTGPWALFTTNPHDTRLGRCDENKLLGSFGMHVLYGSTHQYKSFGQSTGWGTGMINTRSIIPQIRFNGQENIINKSGVYSLTIKYNNIDTSRAKQEAGIIIGEIAFDNEGYVTAEGADWDRLLNVQRQTQLPYAHGARGKPIWLSHKISEPWNDGVELKFRIDTNKNTVVYQKGNTPKKELWNVLSFTNNCEYPEFLKVFAYCGDTTVRNDHTATSKVSLTILGKSKSNSNSNSNSNEQD